MGFSSILTGLNFIVTIHKLRAPGMTMMRLPLFVWAIYATALIQVIATPVLGITLLLLVAERVFGIGVFDPTLGGDPVLFQHFFWFYSHPAVYIMIVPPFGVISEVISTFSQKTIFGYKAIAFSSLAISAISFLVWGHHMFVSGQSPVAGTVFSILTMLVGVPTAIKLFNWTATMYKGPHQSYNTYALRDCVPLLIHNWRAYRSFLGRFCYRRALARHVLRRRSLPLRYARWRHCGHVLRTILLVS